MSYDEAVINAAISIYSSKQIGNPKSAIDLAEAFVDMLVETKYVDPPEDAEPNTANQSDK